MEKRRVRIYKAGGQSGSYINKTAKYFQDGGMQNEQPAPEPTDEQIVTYILQSLSQPNGSLEQVKQQLVQANINPARITQLSETALEYINELQSTQQVPDNSTEEEDAAMQAEQDQQDQLTADEEQVNERKVQLQKLYDQSDEDQFDPNENDYTPYMRNGGMLNKKKYINDYMKLVKKQQGGDTEEFKADLKTDIPIGGREEKVFKFHNALKSSANNAALRQQAEKAYAQEGGSMFPEQNEDPENPMHHIGAYATGIHDIFDSPQVGTSSGSEQLQQGGFTDQESGLYKFMGGGEDMTQADLDYTNSKNISSPYFQSGGIRSSGTPKRYKGSDGQMHWIGSREGYKPVKSLKHSKQKINPETNRPETRERPLANMLMKSRIPGLMNLGARMYPWEAIPTDETVWTNTNVDQGPAYSNVPSQGIIPFVNDQLNVDLNRQPYVSPIPEFGENAPYNPDMINMQERNPFPNYYDFTGPQMAYGGYIPRAQFGTQQDLQQQAPFTGVGTGDIPIGYFKDPKTGLIKNLAGDIYSPKTNLEGKSDKLMNASTPNSMNYQKNELTGEKSALQMGTDGNYVNTGVLTDKDKEAGAMQPVSQNLDSGNQSSITVGGNDKLDKFNAMGNAFAGFMERGEDKRQEAKMAHRFNADNLYATTTATDRGTYDQEGRFRLDEEGFTGVAKYGGYMEEGGSYEEGGDTWMSEEQIQRFLAEGGELEFV